MLHQVQQKFDIIFHHPQVKTMVGVVVTFVLGAVGENYLAYEILCILVVIDVLTGLMKGFKAKNISSRRFSKKGVDLLVYFMIVVAAHQMTRIAPMLHWLEQFIVLFLAVTEMISIIENAYALGVKVPVWVVSYLDQYANNQFNSKQKEIEIK